MSDNPHWDEYQTMLAQYPAECGGEECIGECPIGTPCRGWWDIVVFEIRTQIYDKHDRYSVRSKDVLAWLQKQRFDKSGPFEWLTERLAFDFWHKECQSKASQQ